MLKNQRVDSYTLFLSKTGEKQTHTYIQNSKQTKAGRGLGLADFVCGVVLILVRNT